MDYLPEDIRDNYKIFDGDKLYMQKQRELWPSGITANKEAKKIALKWVVDTFDGLVEKALANKNNFVYEGHFTNDATSETPKRFKENGYTLNILFFGLANPDLSELRVIDRVKEGGHFVPRALVEDNFYGNLEKLNKYFHLIDNLRIVDTSEAIHTTLISRTNGTTHFFVEPGNLPEWLKTFLPNIL